MRGFYPLTHAPARVASGLYILNSGLGKRDVPEQAAKGVHGFATAAYPFLAGMPPAEFAKNLSRAEVALGVALLVPVVPTGLAAGALLGFSAGMMGLYLRAPGLRRPGSLAWTEQGQAIAKDVWMVGIAGTLLADAVRRRRQTR